MQGSGGADCETASNVRRHRGYRWAMGQDRNIDMEIHRSSSNSSCTTYSAKIILLLGILVMIVMVFPSLVSDEGQVHDSVSQQLRPTSWKGSRAHQQRRLRSLRCAQQQCGDMEIPYPFGLSSDCAMNSFFELDCLFTRGINDIGEYEIGFWPFLTNVAAGVAAGSYQSLANNSVVPYDFSANSFQVLNISDNKIVIETTSMKAMSCWGDDRIYGNASISLPDDGPYRLSGDNILAAVGCRSRVRYSVTSDDVVAGVCGPNSCNNQNYYHYCNTYDCCTMSIQPALNIRLTGGGIAFQYFSTCGYASLLWPDSYRTSHSAFFGNGTYGTELLWAIPVVAQPMNDTLCDDGPGSVKDSPDYVCARTMAKCKNVRIKSSDDSASEMTGYYCTCKRGYEGDGYKNGSSCTDIDECADDSLNECVPGAVCTNLPGSYSCSCQSGAQGDGFTNGTGCTGSGGPNTPLIVGLSTVSGALVVVTLGGLCLWWYYRRQRKNQPVDPTLSRMDILREMQIKGGAKICKIFMLEELEKATSNFADHKVIGVGGFGKIYQGTLDDGTEVAIKKAKRDVTGGRDDTKQFINEVTILSTINHQNLVKLLGCCLETMVPILVYEFISNGSLLDYIKRSKPLPNKRFDETSSKSLDWDQRLKIAIGTATALSYLHSGTSPPIYHRDVKSANILLDKNYVAKVADFGLSKLVPADEEETHVSTAVQGTPGYLDPEYFEIYQLTEKSDVYSFGVVLLELLTAEKALDFSRPGQDQNLALRCRRLLKFGLFEQVLDSSLDAPSHPDVLEAVYNVAQVAMECCERYGDNRPTMRQVENRLRSLRESSGLRSPSSYTSNVTDRGRTGYIGYDLETDDTYDSTPITSREFTNSEDPIHSNKFASGSSDSGGHIRQRSRDLELGNMRRKQRDFAFYSFEMEVFNKCKRLKLNQRIVVLMNWCAGRFPNASIPGDGSVAYTIEHDANHGDAPSKAL